MPKSAGFSLPLTEIFLNALHITKPEFSNEKDNLFSPIEIECIIYLIQLEYEIWSVNEAENILLKLLDYVKEIYSEKMKQEIGPKILMELLKINKRIKKENKVIMYADEAIDLISKGREIQYIAEFHFEKAKAIERYYRYNEKWEDKRKKCIEECIMAYYVFDIMNKNEKQEVCKFCEEKLEWQIIE